MTYVIAEPCIDVKDKSCIDVCPVDCIYEGSRTLYIHPDECVDCSACEPVCPVEAIFEEDSLPEQYAVYLTVDAEFFTKVTDLGTPGGADRVGPQGVDHPVVAGARLAGSKT
jgi:NAD-dependent dihydropyrimidine dehydrogenase PreA subunit